MSDITQLGLIGYPLGHSFSANYFAEKFVKENITGYHYELYPITGMINFRLLLHFHPYIQGLNVTIPYKESVVPFLDEVDPVAEAIGAVNTITFKDGKTKGYNTDITGFEESLSKFLKKTNQTPKGALILGSGGAAKAISYSFTQSKLPFKIISRDPEDGQLAYSQINKELLSEYQLIVNTTPLGTFPKVKEFPGIPYDLLSKDNLLFDLIYNPEKSLFLSQGEGQGCAIQNGYDMLVAQAEHSWKIWTS